MTVVSTYAHADGGAGYVQGNSQSSAGNILTGRSKGSIIYVAMQYRLGGLGFLSSSAVKSDGTPNAGLLDQRSAIEWIQRNIASFGGDPCKITIIGGSAGGGSVSAQLQLYGGVSNPPFRAAIPGGHAALDARRMLTPCYVRVPMVAALSYR